MWCKELLNANRSTHAYLQYSPWCVVAASLTRGSLGSHHLVSTDVKIMQQLTHDDDGNLMVLPLYLSSKQHYTAQAKISPLYQCSYQIILSAAKAEWVIRDEEMLIKKGEY